jgi:poly(A) polymerase
LIHPALAKIRDALTDTKYRNELYLVGGAVRDELLGLDSSSDFDLVSIHPGIELAQLLFEEGVSSIFPVTFEAFGTAMVIVDDLKIEIVQCRKESYRHGSRKPSVEPGGYEDDALRRDFTLNALMKDLWTEKIVDVLGSGINDLRSGVLRTPLDPLRTFEEDPLRILRAVRFKHRFGFEYADGLEESIRARAPELQNISHERIREELVKMCLLPAADLAMREMMELGLFTQFAPEFEPMVGCEQGTYHVHDVWNHTLLVVKNTFGSEISIREELNEDDRIALTLGALFHDIGKPATRSLGKAGVVHFFTHEHVGADLCRAVMRRLKFSNHEIDRVSLLVKHHMRLGNAESFSTPAARRFLRDLGSDWRLMMRLIDADRRGMKQGILKADLEDIVQKLESVNSEQAAPQFEPPLSGLEIMEILQIQPGPDVKRWKVWLTGKVLDGELGGSDKETARAMLIKAHQKWHQE